MTAWLPIVEALTLGASILGVLLSIATGQTAYALIPIVLSLLLNQWNRRQGDLRNRQGSMVALRRARQDLAEEIQTLQHTLKQQSLGTSPYPLNSPDLLQNFPPAATPEIERAILQIQLQNARLDAILHRVIQALNQLLPTPIELPEPIASSPPWSPTPPVQTATPGGSDPSSIASGGVLDPRWQEALRWQRGHSLAAHGGWVNAIALSPDGQQLATGGNDQHIRFWQVSSGDPLGHCLSSSPISALAFSPDGRLLASGNYDHRIQIWRVADQTLVTPLEGHEGSVQTLAFVGNPEFGEDSGSPDDRFPGVRGSLVSGSYDQSLRFWDLATGQGDRHLAHEGSVHCLAIDPQQRHLVSGGEEGHICLWQLPEGTLIQTLSRNRSAVEALSLSPDGQFLAVGGGDGSLHLWQLSTQTLCYAQEAHTGPVTALVITPDGQTLISGGADGRLKVWHLPTGQAWGNLAEPVDGILSLALSQNGTLLVSSHPGGKVQFWHRDRAEG